MTGLLRGISAALFLWRIRHIVRVGLLGLAGAVGLAVCGGLAALGATEGCRPCPRQARGRGGGGTLALAAFRADPGAFAPQLAGIRLAPMRYRTFRFQVTPPIWQVSLDGRPLPGGPGTPLWARVGPGPHTILFEHPTVFPVRFDLAATEPGRTLRARLRWRPATLFVRVAPREARASFQFLAPRFLAERPPMPANLPQVIRFGPRVQDVPLARIRVFAVGYRHEEREVRLVPGERTHVAVLIRPLVGKLSDDELARR